MDFRGLYTNGSKHQKKRYKETVKHLKQIGLKRCRKCNMWVDKEDIREGGACFECNSKKVIV
jgi:hypothetical protein